MKFSEMSYKRAEYENVKAEFSKILSSFRSAAGAGAQLEAAKQFYRLEDDVSTMENIAYIRHTVDTTDKFYSDEMDYYNESLPKFEELKTQFLRALLAAPYRAELEKHLGSLCFKNAEIALRAFDEKIMGDMAQENKLTTQYEKLIASAQVDFGGKTLTLAQLGFYMNSADRQTRRQAYAARTGFFMQHVDELDDIYDRLVKNRDAQARKLGYKNFVELGYLRMNRNCYGAEDVAAFRKLVREKLVPVTMKITKRRSETLGIRDLKFYDDGIFYREGNPQPVGTPEQIFQNGLKMYRELSPETGEFFDFMLRNDLFDALAKKGKATGGYCTGIPNYRSPFIFANFNGTFDDINTLTHEAGHAFQFYLSRNNFPPEYRFPTMESAEIDSMSMEFFTWPWMELFFGKNADRYRYMHLSGTLLFIPYGCMVDEFQHIAYENPSLTPRERKKAWQDLEKTYQPYLDYDGDPFFGEGGKWQRQHHIYENPFYYIDYCLAQTCALEFWALMQKDRTKAWEKYLTLCRLGGTKTFIGLLDTIGFENPFHEGCLETVAQAAEHFLENFDAGKLK